MSAVVVGTDGTVHCDGALRFAAREAQLRGAELVVVLGYGGPIDPDVDDFETPKSVQVLLHEPKAIDALVRALGMPAESLPPHRIVCDDLDPTVLLLHVSTGVDAELIVIGQQHRHLFDRLVHGPSRVGRLARHSRVPVAVVPAAAAVPAHVPDHRLTGDGETRENR